MATLRDVYERARTNYSFAISILANPENTCTSAGLALSPDDLERLKKVVYDVYVDYGEKLFVAACEGQGLAHFAPPPPF